MGNGDDLHLKRRSATQRSATLESASPVV